MGEKARQRKLSKEDKLLAKQIRELREKQNLTQEELSARLGKNFSYIAYIETGRRGLSLPTVYRIARILGVEVKELFDF